MNSSPKSNSPQEILDPVAAYDRLAPYYSQFSQKRAAYLRSVEEQVISRIPAGPQSLLDIGAGDGSRASRIAAAAGISTVVLLEPSAKMSAAAASGVWQLRVEELDASKILDRFDVITCLWNVLGHVQGTDARVRALNTAAQLLSPTGLFFADVIHRYNVRSYGIVMTAARWLRDQLAPGDTNGDVVARWKTAAADIKTCGHVFTHSEVQRITESAGLECVARVVIDYESGALRKRSCQGNLLYVFRRKS